MYATTNLELEHKDSEFCVPKILFTSLIFRNTESPELLELLLYFVQHQYPTENVEASQIYFICTFCLYMSTIFASAHHYVCITEAANRKTKTQRHSSFAFLFFPQKNYISCMMKTG